MLKIRNNYNFFHVTKARFMVSVCLPSSPPKFGLHDQYLLILVETLFHQTLSPVCTLQYPTISNTNIATECTYELNMIMARLTIVS